MPEHEGQRSCGMASGSTQAVAPSNSRQRASTTVLCAVKGAGQQRVQVPPGNWIAPPGSNRSSGRGDEAAGASGVEGREGDLASMQAV
jgi:hypothetical protein